MADSYGIPVQRREHSPSVPRHSPQLARATGSGRSVIIALLHGLGMEGQAECRRRSRRGGILTAGVAALLVTGAVGGGYDPCNFDNSELPHARARHFKMSHFARVHRCNLGFKILTRTSF